MSGCCLQLVLTAFCFAFPHMHLGADVSDPFQTSSVLFPQGRPQSIELLVFVRPMLMKPIPCWMHRARNDSEISTAVSVVAMWRPSWKLRATLRSPPIPQMGRAVGSCSFHSRFKCSCDRFIPGCMHRARSERSRHGSNMACYVSNHVRPRPG